MHDAILQLMTAVRHDDVNLARRVLAERPDIARESVHVAAAVGDVAAVEALLAADPGLATRGIGPTGTTPLVFAVQSALPRALGVSDERQAQVVAALLDKGADANTSVALPDVHGAIPVLYFPSVAGNVPVVRVLLEHGANPTDGESVYHAAQHDHRDVLSLLLAYGADLSRGPDGTGNSPLHFLASHHRSNPISSTVLRGMAWLLEHGADPSVPLTAIGDGQHAAQLGETPLHRLAANGYDGDVMGMLLAYGAALEAPRDDGATPLVLAVRHGNAEGARWLIANGADGTRVTPADRLLHACLLANGDEARALMQTHPGLLDTLHDRDAGALLQALVELKRDAVRLMLSLGWPLTPESEWGGTALHWTAWHGDVELVHLLLQHGAPVNARDSRYGSSPIAWAAHGSTHSGRQQDEASADAYLMIVGLLLDAGATREPSFNRWGESPESLAQPAVADLLRRRGFVDASS
jgi:ankyrin repeat protein